MLVLTRKPDQSLNLHTSDGVIEIYIASVVGEQVKISINAPRTVDVARSEIDSRVEQPNYSASR